MKGWAGGQRESGLLDSGIEDYGRSPNHTFHRIANAPSELAVEAVEKVLQTS